MIYAIFKTQFSAVRTFLPIFSRFAYKKLIYELRCFQNTILGGPYVSPIFSRFVVNLRIIYVGAFKDWLQIH
jgi:hypothetical protein